MTLWALRDTKGPLGVCAAHSQLAFLSNSKAFRILWIFQAKPWRPQQQFHSGAGVMGSAGAKEGILGGSTCQGKGKHWGLMSCSRAPGECFGGSEEQCCVCSDGYW